jgi:DNA-binding NtrC family response regulator
MAGIDERKRILVVDDQESVRLAMRAALELAGYGVVEAEDAAEALAAMDEPPLLIFVDNRLPGGASGIELAREIRRRWFGPIVLMSGDPAVKQAAAEIGVAMFLAKPFRPSELMLLVERALHRADAGRCGPLGRARRAVAGLTETGAEPTLRTY